MSVLLLADLKLRLNKTTAADDVELQAMLDAAEAEYSARVSPITGDTVRYDASRQIIVPRNSTVTAVAYSNGTVIPLASLYHNENSGVLDWNYLYSSTPTYMFWGAVTDVDVTFTTALPAHHKEAILADAAGLWASSQRGNSAGALPTGYETGLEERTTPITLFPRIKALADSFSGIG